VGAAGGVRSEFEEIFNEFIVIKCFLICGLLTRLLGGRQLGDSRILALTQTLELLVDL
jgi:hypothetical protein